MLHGSRCCMDSMLQSRRQRNPHDGWRIWNWLRKGTTPQLPSSCVSHLSACLMHSQPLLSQGGPSKTGTWIIEKTSINQSRLVKKWTSCDYRSGVLATCQNRIRSCLSYFARLASRRDELSSLQVRLWLVNTKRMEKNKDRNSRQFQTETLSNQPHLREHFLIGLEDDARQHFQTHHALRLSLTKECDMCFASFRFVQGEVLKSFGRPQGSSVLS